MTTTSLPVRPNETTGAKKFSPFSITIETELFWSTMTSREIPSDEYVINASSSKILSELCHDLSIVGIIGSLQVQRIYFNNQKKKLHISEDKKILKRHELARAKNIIPIFTLGSTGMMVANGNTDQSNAWKTYSTDKVLGKLAFFQLLGSLKQTDPGIRISKAEDGTPFTAIIHRNEKPFHVLVVRGNETEINQFFRYQSERIPERILILVEEFTHFFPIQDYVKPYAKRIRLTTDHDLTEPFESMFYHFKENEWQKELLPV